MQHMLVKQHLENRLTSGSLLQLYSLYFYDETGSIDLVDTDEIAPLRAAASLSIQPQSDDAIRLDTQEPNPRLGNAIQHHAEDDNTTYQHDQDNRLTN